MYCIYTPVGDSRLPSAVTDILTIKILNALLPETHSANELVSHCAISGHTIFVVSTHNRTPTSLFAIATKKRRNFVTILHVASRPPLA